MNPIFHQNGFRWKDTNSWTFQLQHAGPIFAVPLDGEGTAGEGNWELQRVYLQDLWCSLQPTCCHLFYFLSTPRTTTFERWVVSCMLNIHFHFVDNFSWKRSLLFKLCGGRNQGFHWFILKSVACISSTPGFVWPFIRPEGKTGHMFTDCRWDNGFVSQYWSRYMFSDSVMIR